MKMIAQDLRIGNWVAYGLHSPLVIVSINSAGWIETKPTVDGYVSEFNGIPLTPDLLERCGFVKSDKSPYSDMPAYVIGEDAQRIYWCANDLFKILPDGFIAITNYKHLPRRECVEYLHQLQNAIYFLTDTELIINNA